MSSIGLVQFSFPYVYAGETMAIGVTLPVACIAVVALRLYTRRLQRLKYRLNDLLSLAGLFPVLGMGICFNYGTATHVFGYPTRSTPTNLSEDQLLYYIDPTSVVAQQIEFPPQILMMIAYAFIKTSIMAFCRRLFIVQKRSIFRMITMAAQIVIVLWSIAFILLVIFPCGKEIWVNWAAAIYQLQYCNISFTSEYGLVISDLIIDIILFIMPLPMIWNLRVTPQRKLAVSGIMLLGVSAVGASIGRLVLYVQILNIEEAAAAAPPDVNLVTTVALWWTLLECGLALIAACLPTLSYFLTKFSMQSMLESVRSAFPLHSAADQTSESVAFSGSGAIDAYQRPYVDLETMTSTGSPMKITKSTEIEATGY